jgi:hypothetical protein
VLRREPTDTDIYEVAELDCTMGDGGAFVRFDTLNRVIDVTDKSFDGKIVA